MKGLDHQPLWVRRVVGIGAFLLLIIIGPVSPGDGIITIALWFMLAMLSIDAVLNETRRTKG